MKFRTDNWVLTKQVKFGFISMIIINLGLSSFSIYNIWRTKIDNSQLAIPLGIGILSLFLGLGLMRIVNNQIKHRIAKIKEASKVCQSSTREASNATEEMASSSEEINGSVKEIFSSVKDLSKANREGNVAVKEVSTSMTDSSRAVEEIANSIQETSASVQNLAADADNVKNNADRSYREMNETNSLIEHGFSMLEQTLNTMHSLGKQLNKIDNISSTIIEIADQTNLLALNAAIEAARAGEAGRGFSVVADEIRELAKKSNNSINMIQDIIKRIKDNAREVGDLLDNQNQAESVNGIFNDIDSNAKKVLTSMENLVNIAESQAAQTEEVSATTEEISASSEELSAQIQEVFSSIETISEQFDVTEETQKKLDETMDDVSGANDDFSAGIEELSGNTEEIAAMIDTLVEQVEFLG
ncbi:MAG: methyl-accepting chemotaxis protein [bacterium]